MFGLSAATVHSSPWDVVITEWALDTYLNLKHGQVFSAVEYRAILRPDVELLRDGIPSPHPKFNNPKFWGPATQPGGVTLPGGYKMKWHNLGAGQVQLRLAVANVSGVRAAFLCEAYVKSNDATDRRMLARFKSHMNKIALGQYSSRGKI